MNNVSSLQIDYDMNPPDTLPHASRTAFSRLPMKLDVSLEDIRKCRDSGEAFRLACIASCLDDKEIYTPLGIDQGYFSKIRTGDATLKKSLEREFCKIVGNHIYPEWCAWQHGFTLVPVDGGNKDRLSALEDKIEQLLVLLKSKGSI